MTLEKSTVMLSWMAGLILGIGVAIPSEDGWYLMVVGILMMLVVVFGFVPMFKNSQ